MGADIHWITEVKLYGRWTVYSQPIIDRDYEFFGFLAGVRRPKNQYFNVKGLPSNASDLTRLCFDQGGWHTATYFNMHELREIEKWLISNRKIISIEYDYIGYCFGSSWQEASFPDGITDARFIVGFDS